MLLCLLCVLQFTSAAVAEIAKLAVDINKMMVRPLSYHNHIVNFPFATMDPHMYVVCRIEEEIFLSWDMSALYDTQDCPFESQDS